MSRHARRRGGRHERRYQGWGPHLNTVQSLDEAEALALSQTPPMGFPAVQVPVYAPPPPRQAMPSSLRWLIAAGACLFSLVTGAVIILAFAFAMGAPEPAQAEDRYQPVEIVVKDGKARLKNGVYTVEEASP